MKTLILETKGFGNRQASNFANAAGIFDSFRMSRGDIPRAKP